MGTSRRHLKTLCDLMIEHELDLKWYCSMRADSVTEELADLIAKAGCHSVLMGIETSDDQVLVELKTGKEGSLTERSISHLRRAGIDVHGHFIIGLPGESERAALKTIDWACSLDIGLASFANPSPDYGTVLRKMAIEKSLIDDSTIANSDRSAEAINLNEEISGPRLRQLVGKANRDYYLRGKVFARMIGLMWKNPRLIKTVLQNSIIVAQRFFIPFGAKP